MGAYGVDMLLPWHPVSTTASPMTGTESRWRIAKPVKSVWRQIGLKANYRRRGGRLKAPHILLPQRLVSVTCLTPDINATGVLVGRGPCPRRDYVLTLRVAQASPA